MEKKIKKISYSQPIKKNKNMEVLWRRKKEKRKNHVSWLVTTCPIFFIFGKILIMMDYEFFHLLWQSINKKK